MEPTGRFLIRILDSEKNTIISNKAQSLVASMTKVSAFKSFVMQATKNIGNGDINSFFIETDFDLDEEDMQYGDKLVFDLPAELSVVGDLKCYAHFDYLRFCKSKTTNGITRVTAFLNKSRRSNR